MADDYENSFDYKYKQFLIDRLLKKVEGYSNKYHKPTEILNIDFMGNYFLGLFEVGNDYILSVDNTKKRYADVIMYCKPNNKGYRVNNRNSLKKYCPKTLFKMFLDNGLYASEKAKNSKKNNYFALHRLICCISEDILEREIHHEDEKPESNSKINLKPLTEAEHDKLHPDRKKYA